MQYSKVRRLAARTGATAWLERVGLRGPVSELARFLINPAERERWHIIRQDFQTSREQFRQIARGASVGDPRKVAWMICSMPTVWGLKMEGILSLAVRLRSFYPVAVHLNHSSWSRRYHELFGIDRVINFQKFLTAIPSVTPASEILEFANSRPTVRDLLQLTYRQVDIGRVALSNVLNRNKFTKFDLAQPDTFAEVHEELLRIQHNVVAAENMLAQGCPVVALLLEKGLSPMAEIFGVCVAKGVPVVQYVGSQNMNDYVLKRFTLTNRHEHPFSLDAPTWEQVKNMRWFPGYDAEMMKGFAESYEIGTWFNRKFLHQGKQIKSAETVRQQLGLDPSKKTAVVFSHVLWDATFFYGEGLFGDYETWLVRTVRAACANPRVNWVVKLHPDLVWKLKYESYTGELRDLIAIRSDVGALPDHVKLVPPDTDISTYSFFEITDFCITVRGTIGIEMACRGVPVVTGGTGRYSGLGFTIDSSSADEYLQRLAHIESLPPMFPKQIELARRFAYALFKLRPWPMRSFEWTKMPIERTGHPLSDNLLPHVESFAEFAAAPDMQLLADWIASDQVDYISLSATSR